MVAVALGFTVLALLLTVGGGLLLYLFVRSEHDRRRVTDRESAERMARRDGGGHDGDGRDGDRENDGEDQRARDEPAGNHWG